MSLLLYVHVPFCRSKCRYCAFSSQIFDAEALERYLEAVGQEARIMSGRLHSPSVATVYFGGGTPSILPAWGLERLARTILDNFKVPKGTEWTIEANPGAELDREALAMLLSMGVNRLSLGVQSFNDGELAALGRPHTGKDAMQAFEHAREAGFRNISLDLIWGLPGQKLRSYLESVKAAIVLRPDHVSTYGLTVEPGTPLAGDVAEGRGDLPEENEAASMYMRGSDLLEEHGLIQYEISNFARMGLHSRHNTGYWHGADYLGLGPAAVSTIGRLRVKNPASLEEYVQSVASGKGTQVEKLDEATKALERAMLSLRTTEGLNVDDFLAGTGRNLMTEQPRLLAGLRQNDLIRLGKGRIKLTRKGMLVSNVVLERLLFAGHADNVPNPPKEIGG